eukprot:14094998-Ditylum_brightwellii.AAC.1
MQGAAGQGGVDSIAWRDWILQYGIASRKLREGVATVARWLANTRPAWAAYQALVTGRLIVLDKCPGIRPVGIGEILFRMIGKCIIAVCGDEVAKACGIHQLCFILKAGIEGAVYSMKQMWDDHAKEDGWGILL